MSHKKLLSQGKINDKEFRRLAELKKEKNPAYYALEGKWGKRPVGYFTRRGKRTPIHG